MPENTFKKATFWVEENSSENTEFFQGWTNGELRDNYWQMPWFGIAVAQQVMKTSWGAITFNPATQYFHYQTYKGELVLKPVDLTINGEVRQLYNFGLLGWCWQK